jgi:O-antigen ligase
LAVVVVALGASAFSVAVSARFGAHPEALYVGGRLVAPISYVNAAAAFFLVGLWPALVLAARRGLHPLLRGVALAAATAMLAGWLGTQSKGGAVALVVSAIAVFAFVPGRLRLLVPTLLTGILVLSQYHPLTGPFRAQDDIEAARRAGTVWLLIVAAALVAGLAYALADGRLRITPRAHKTAAIAVAAAGALALAVGAWQADRRIDDRSAFLQEQWEIFKRSQPTESGSSHLVNLGSNRYDFWRVSLAGFEDHPIGGIGGRGFGPWYLQHGDSYETPARAHSLPLDALLETGIIGLGLLLAAFAAILAGLVRRLDTVAGAAAFGALVYFAVHAGGDWVWTFPAVGLPLFALIGLALAPADGWALAGRRAAVAAAAVAVFALAAFMPPWLSSRVTNSALSGETEVESLRWARALDPLAVEPYLAEAALATSPGEAISPLESAVEKEPRAVNHRLVLGRAYLAAGRAGDALEQLRVADALFPGDDDIRETLARARRAAG